MSFFQVSLKAGITADGIIPMGSASEKKKKRTTGETRRAVTDKKTHKVTELTKTIKLPLFLWKFRRIFYIALGFDMPFSILSCCLHNAVVLVIYYLATFFQINICNISLHARRGFRRLVNNFSLLLFCSVERWKSQTRRLRLVTSISHSKNSIHISSEYRRIFLEHCSFVIPLGPLQDLEPTVTVFPFLFFSC